MTQTATQPVHRIAINGFGRIGRGVLRAYLERGCPAGVEITAINDVADAKTLLHLLKYDSVHGRLKFTATLDDGALLIQAARTLRIPLLDCPEPQKTNWRNHQVDTVLECTGLFRSRELASLHLSAGAKRVIIGAAPFDDVDCDVVFGVNHDQIKPSDQIISSVSCTTQALVPLVTLLDETFGIEHALMTEIHAVTADQNVLDQPHRDLRRARTAQSNIIPTTSSALGALVRVMPHMHGRVEGHSLRVPTDDVAAIDLTAHLKRRVSAADLNQVLKHASENQYAGIMAVTDEPLVSSDFIGDAHSLTVDMQLTSSLGDLVKIFAWFDNEWGYANRLLDLCLALPEPKA